MSVMDWVSGRMFNLVHRKNLVYNTCWEDPRLDRVALDLGPDDELMMITARGKIQRVRAADVSIVGRNTQGVTIMNLSRGDTLVAVKRVPQESNGDNGGEHASPD